MEIRRRIVVSGIVQGVGFRPYVHRLATARQLNGWVTNTASGVSIEVQGTDDSVEEFLQSLCSEAPPLAQITNTSVLDLPCNNDRGFRILTSYKHETASTLISPDITTCDDCLRELLDPADRRYRYPFINCTNCGPRFTIIRDIPYDRVRTSMSTFALCSTCQAEYEDPLNRRFHAQPNACWDCGPKLQLWDQDERTVDIADPIVATVLALKAGKIVAIKGLGGFHLVADATNPDAVALLRERKRRVAKPFAIMVANLAAAEALCEVNEAERQALQSMQRPIVLLRRKSTTLITDQVSPSNRDLGVFLPYTPIHHLLFAEGQFAALVMTSGNISEEPIAIDNEETRSRLHDLADYSLVHNRDILLRCDDSVVRVIDGRTQQIRRSRGFVPVPVFLHKEIPTILAVGGELKNTICLTKGSHAFLSQHIGDLENIESYKFFGEGIEHLGSILETKPEIIAYDLHPDYFSTKWALAQKDLPTIGVQHHHAHIASCMAENHLDEDVIGFALDGTGYGTDGTVWGGEVLIANYGDFERAAHFEYVPMPGASSAILEPWRMAVSYLALHFGRDFQTLKVPFLDAIDPQKVTLSLQMMKSRINSPLTSSCGRLFDAVAALAGIRQCVTYEAQAAVELEMAMVPLRGETPYQLEVAQKDGGYVIRTRAMFAELIHDLHRSAPAGLISARFHEGLIRIFVTIAQALRERTRLNRVCLSGGTFNNRYLAEHLHHELVDKRFEVFTQNEVPCGDGGLSLGQAMVAAHKIARGASP